MRRFKAFTLAEVLITLGVIGVVSAITMPTLIQNHKKQVTVTQLKATYSTFSQAFKMAEAEYGLPENWNRGPDIDKFVKTYISPYVKLLEVNETSPKHYYLNGEGDYAYNNAEKYYIFANGNEMAVQYSTYYDTYFFRIDLNGNKGPNILGKDYFLFDLGKTKFNLNGAYASRDELVGASTSSCTKNGYGNWCGGLIQKDGWKIEKDYPW